MKVLPTLASLLVVAATHASAQSSSAVSKDGTKPRPDPQPYYTPYTGPGFGNPDANARENAPVGKSRKKFHDAPGTSAYSKSGNTEATPLDPPPRKRKSAKKDDKDKRNGESPAGEKR